MPRAFAPNAHHLGHWTEAAWSGLRPAPESRSRGARPHLLRSFTTRFSASPSFPCCLCSTQHPLKMGRRRGCGTIAAARQPTGAPHERDDLSQSLVAFDQASKIVAVVEE